MFTSRSEFVVGRKLGEGSYATVRKAIHIASEETYALKIISLDELDLDDYENVQKEIEIHSSIESKYVIRLIDYFEDSNKVYLVLEFAHYGNLYKYMQSKFPLPVETIGRMWTQAVLAIEFLHSQAIVMRDLKPENILLDKQLNVKICDFGWAARIQDAEYRSRKAGTYVYMSPESLQGMLQGFASDVWSLGVLLYEMTHHKEPYMIGFSCDEQLKFIKEDDVKFKNISDDRIQKLIKKMLY